MDRLEAKFGRPSGEWSIKQWQIATETLAHLVGVAYETTEVGMWRRKPPPEPRRARGRPRKVRGLLSGSGGGLLSLSESKPAGRPRKWTQEDYSDLIDIVEVFRDDEFERTGRVLTDTQSLELLINSWAEKAGRSKIKARNEHLGRFKTALSRARRVRNRPRKSG
jgi:hypothetical protein